MSPLYEHLCRNHLCPTGHFVVRLSISQAANRDVRCPDCDEKAKRLYSPPSGKWGDTPKFHGSVK